MGIHMVLNQSNFFRSTIQTFSGRPMIPNNKIGTFCNFHFMVGQKIKRLRQQKGYSITELGRLADVSKSYLSQLERGLQTNPSLQFLVKVAEPLDTSVQYLL